MANTSSAIKAARQAVKRTIANARFKSKLKQSLKTVSKETLAATVSLVDKAAKKNLIHPNKASRLKSQLMKSHGIPTAKRTVAAAPKAEKPAKAAKTTKKPAAKKTTKKADK